jgi:hypothetical protein
MNLRRLLRAQWDRALGGGCIALGAIALLLGWLGVSGSALGYEQLPYVVSGGLVGVVLIGMGLTALLSADLRDQWRSIDSLDSSVRELREQLEAGQLRPVGSQTRRGRRPAELSRQ